MGINGFAFNNDSVNFLKNCEDTVFKQRKLYSKVFSIGMIKLPLQEQEQIGEIFGSEQPYNNKSDNFLDLK